MPKIVVTLTKANDAPWILASATNGAYDIFTMEEKLQYLKPYVEYLKSLPGYSYEQSSVESYIDGDTSVTSICFDTQENMTSAMDMLFGNNMAPVVQTRNQFISTKLRSANVFYNRTITTE